MRRIGFILLLSMLLVSAVMCAKSNSNSKGEEEKNVSAKNNINENTAVNNNTKENKILIAYFSRPGENYAVGVVEVGSTELIANHIKNYLGSRTDVFKIEATQPYPRGYEDTKTRATREKTNNERPTFKGDVDISKYDVVFLGYPIWWGDAPMIIETFLEKYDFRGKIIIPFNTHEGSGNAGTYNHIKNKMSNANVNTNGLAVAGTEARKNNSKQTVENWLKSLGY